MITEKARSAGFCFGVARAMDITEGQISLGKKVVTLGPLIHNPQVVESLRARGVVSVDRVEDVPKGATMIIRSHGVPKETYDKAAALGIEVVDATCPFVAKIHKIVGESNKEGLPVLIAGDGKHPEVMGILGHCAAEAEVFNTK